MNIWNKVLIGFIFFAGFGLLYLGMKTLRTQQTWRVQAVKLERDLEAIKASNQALYDGDPAQNKLSIPQLQSSVNDWLSDRGRVWMGTAPEQVEQATGRAGVRVNYPQPPRIAPNMILFVFEERPGGQYLGEFRVEGVAESLVQLAPSLKLSQRELAKIAATQGTWSLRERMPVDRHSLFRGMDAAALTALFGDLPADVLNEYVHDGQAATPDDPPDRVADAKYERSLRDYAQAFRDLHRHMAHTGDSIAATQIDLAFAQSTRDATQVQIDQRQAEIDQKLTPELAEVSAERDLVQSHRTAVEATLADVRAQVDTLLAEIKSLADEYTALQLERAQEIDAITGEQASVRD